MYGQYKIKTGKVYCAGVYGTGKSLLLALCAALLCDALLYMLPYVIPSTAQENKYLQNNVELFRGKIVKSGCLTVQNLEKILDVSFVDPTREYPCRIKTLKPSSLAASSGLATGDEVISASLTGKTLVLGVNRGGQIFRLTTQIPKSAKNQQSLSGNIMAPIPNSFQLSSGVNTLVSASTSDKHGHSRNTPRKPGCNCVEDSWCTDQCPRQAYCNCPSIQKSNMNLSCNWSSPDRGKARNSQMQLSKLHARAQDLQTQRQLLEQELMGQ